MPAKAPSSGVLDFCAVLRQRTSSARNVTVELLGYSSGVEVTSKQLATLGASLRRRAGQSSHPAEVRHLGAVALKAAHDLARAYADFHADTADLFTTGARR